mmetsp:Transcript_21385/g.66292  ORF Transcript_21385/g.66292 Transcript_21385/m.66292 type:complete len:408 (-) Transcript_21385:22-1245(-)
MGRPCRHAREATCVFRRLALREAGLSARAAQLHSVPPRLRVPVEALVPWQDDARARFLSTVLLGFTRCGDALLSYGNHAGEGLVLAIFRFSLAGRQRACSFLGEVPILRAHAHGEHESWGQLSGVRAVRLALSETPDRRFVVVQGELAHRGATLRMTVLRSPLRAGARVQAAKAVHFTWQAPAQSPQQRTASHARPSLASCICASSYVVVARQLGLLVVDLHEAVSDAVHAASEDGTDAWGSYRVDAHALAAREAARFGEAATVDDAALEVLQLLHGSHAALLLLSVLLGEQDTPTASEAMPLAVASVLRLDLKARSVSAVRRFAINEDGCALPQRGNLAAAAALRAKRLVKQALPRQCALSPAPMSAEERTFTLSNQNVFTGGASAGHLLHPSLPIAVIGWGKKKR